MKKIHKYFSPSSVLNAQGYNNIQEICVGPQNIGVLLKDGGICRWATQSIIHQMQLPSSTPQGNNSGTSQAANRLNLPKFRRVMSASSFDRFRRDGAHRLVLDRGRPMLPASSVPEDLISQAQVVLQGKSREVIVRELQRTNLNVNEAVNNLLSRDDDEDDLGEGGEVVLPEELLSLLDPSSASHPILDTELYETDFEYVLGRDIARRRAEKEKDKKWKDNSGSATPTAKSRWELDDQAEWWTADGKGTPEGVERFTMMTATGSELLAVTNTGILYGWSWDHKSGDFAPHKVAKNLISANDPIVQISSSRLRIVCLLKSGKVCSWLDNYLLGDRVCSATEIRPVPLSLNPDETVVQLHVSNHLRLSRTSQNAFHWIGLYPFCEKEVTEHNQSSSSEGQNKISGMERAGHPPTYNQAINSLPAYPSLNQNRDHNQSSSSDDSWQKLVIPYDEFDVVVSDITEEELVEIGHANEIEHLSPGEFSYPAFPVTGYFHGLNIRFMVPLVCQRAGKTNSPAVIVWSHVDTGSPFTCLTVRSLEALVGPGNATHSLYILAIQEQNSKIECKVSKAHFEFVNILGADALKYLNLSIVVDWVEKEFKLIKQ